MLELEVKYKERIDKYISDNSEISRNDIKELIKEGAVYIANNVPVLKPNYIVREGTKIKVVRLIDKEIKMEPIKMEINKVYEDDDLVIIDKPSGLVVHPAPGHHSDTLANGLLYHYKKLSNENGLLRPGIVHRIDKDTSGLLIIAKNDNTHRKLVEMLKKHDIKRSYIAICDGVLENNFTKINLPINRNKTNRKTMAVDKDGKEAITNVTLLKTFYLDKSPMSLIKCDLETGRTHQIRVHMSYIKHPIYGDSVYSKYVDEFNQRLHAFKIEFTHPISNKNIIAYSKIPEQFNIVDYDWDQLKK
ncbi:RluA family pseudouridine synthase [Mycoplasma sp. Mirounga ES2805-ORL]|uniref:RluA family pseudouridine synthase n=1 Tax=Mycoplasma sp. Mirounga ES2805-ORL TaxID=754514 RepID=UPI00197BB255|nr:RluA family pseudouridine synthase [Mycoplasma sp. Mirounga ES2805-ORL]QSF13415.1 RluA family pseudouridine synthase [Mycoplasma sp. Mirounga ES2805-ORL]